MIVGIFGKIKQIKSRSIVIVLPVGLLYEVFCSELLLLNLKEDMEIHLHTKFIVKEHSQILYGFDNEKDLEMFELLISVSGVGAKAAMSILSNFDYKIISSIILENDTKKLFNVSGIGKKTAERIVLELKNRITKPDDIQITTSDYIEDAYQALVILGFKANQVRQVLLQIEGHSTDDLIRKALAKLK